MVGFAQLTKRRRDYPTVKLALLAAVLSLGFSYTCPAQTDPLSGKWEGKFVSPRGEQPSSAVFKKDGAAYSGTILIMTGEQPFKEVKLEGATVTALVAIETPQGTIPIKFNLTLEGDSLKGKGSLEIGGQTIALDVDFKRAAQAAQGGAGGGVPGSNRREPRPESAQPMQQQSIDYFVGTWSAKYLGRESPFGAAPREGSITFTKNPDGTLTGKGVSKYEGGSLDETVTISFDETKKTLTFLERRSNGLQFTSKGDWSSPISIRFDIGPFRIGEKTLAMRRTVSVVSAHSFTLIEEISEDGSPFTRLGNAVYTRVTN